MMLDLMEYVEGRQAVRNVAEEAAYKVTIAARRDMLLVHDAAALLYGPIARRNFDLYEEYPGWRVAIDRFNEAVEAEEVVACVARRYMG